MADYNLMEGNLLISIIVWFIGLGIIGNTLTAVDSDEWTPIGCLAAILYTGLCILSYASTFPIDILDLLLTCLFFLMVIPIYIYEFLSSFSATHILLGSIIILLIIIILILLFRNNDR